MAAFLDVKITDAGKAAAFNAESTGIAVELTAVAFGSLTKSPDGSETGLLREIKRVQIEGGSRILDDQIRVWGLWSSDTEEGDIREIGIYAGDVLFGYYSRDDGGLIGRKVGGGDFVFYYDFKLTEIPADTVTVVFDPDSSVALMMMRVHEADLLAHNHFLRRAEVAQTASRYRWAGLAAGTPDVIELTLPTESLLESYQPGQTFKFIAQFGNTGSVAMRINGLELRSVRKNGSTALVSGDIGQSRVYEVTFDGSNFQIQGSIGIVEEGEEQDGQLFFIHEFIATAGQANFEAPYNIGAIEVFYQGDIVPPARFTATDGANVTLHAPCEAGKEVVIITFQTIAASNVYTKPQTYNRAEILSQMNAKQDSLGFVPVQQGGGVGQLSNKLRLGWDGAKLLAQVDATPLGNLWYSGNFDPTTKATAPKIKTIVVDAVLTASDVGLVLVDCSNGPVTVTLPSAVAGIYDITVRRIDNTTNRLVVQAAGTTERVKFHTHLNISGYAFFVLMGAGDWWQVRSDAAGSWWPIGRLDGGALGRPVFETTVALNPGGHGTIDGALLVRAEWPWLWDHAQNSGMLVTDAARTGKEGSWTSGNGTTTFRKPEARGEFWRVLDEGRGIDAGRTPGSWKSHATEDHTHSSAAGASGVYRVRGDDIPVASSGSGTGGMKTGIAAAETRPRSIAYPGRIKVI